MRRSTFNMSLFLVGHFTGFILGQDYERNRLGNAIARARRDLYGFGGA